MARRKEAGHGGGHGWFVTFADLMGLLVSFFVMLVAFSTQDQAKLQVVAGSMRDAFGVQDRVRYSGIIEVLDCRRGPDLKMLRISTPRKRLLRHRRRKAIDSVPMAPASKRIANSH